MSTEARENSCAVYALVDPRDQRVRYIGHSQAPRKRLSTHRYAGPASSWLREIEEETGERWPFVILRTGLGRKEAREAERTEIWRHLWRGAHLLNGDYPDRRLWDQRSLFPGTVPWESIHAWRRAVQSVPCPQCKAQPTNPCGVWRAGSAVGRFARDRRRVVIEFEPDANHNHRIATYLRHQFSECTGTLRASGDVHADQLEIPMPYAK
ncbi:hypothetical protein [Streptomyces sp. NPDC005877]|uniref:zinc finger domain-containing protein n=1 Tax=Streptomyces sp. NPDC005877 TaxID=3155346 RepID=UPI0033EB1539